MPFIIKTWNDFCLLLYTILVRNVRENGRGEFVTKMPFLYFLDKNRNNKKDIFVACWQ